MMEFKPCIHLDYEKDKYPSCKIIEHDTFTNVRYWERRPFDDLPTKVQFCKKMGRVNAVFDCYEFGFKPCYKPEEDK